MKITVKGYGVDLPQLLGRAFTYEMETGSTLLDLTARLELEIKAKHGWTPEIFSPLFSVLLNRKQVHDFTDKALMRARTQILQPNI